MQGDVAAFSLSWQRSLPFHNTDLDLAAVWRAVEHALWLRWEGRRECVVGWMIGGGSNRFSWCIADSQKDRNYEAPSTKTFGIQIIPGIHRIWLPPCAWDETLSSAVNICISLTRSFCPPSFFTAYSGFVQGIDACIVEAVVVDDAFKEHLTLSPSCHFSLHISISPFVLHPCPSPPLHIRHHKAFLPFSLLVSHHLVTWSVVSC